MTTKFEEKNDKNDQMTKYGSFYEKNVWSNKEYKAFRFDVSKDENITCLVS